MKQATRTKILKMSKELFALGGYDGFSMRNLVKHSGIGQSSIYHFFNDKDEILQEIFVNVGRELGQKRAQLPTTQNASEMLRSRLYFQFENIEDIIFVLKYYLHFRPEFVRLASGYIPPKAYLHVVEVLQKGIETGEFVLTLQDIEEQAKVITHAINGFLIEYYPNPPLGQELEGVVGSIHRFIMRSLTNKEVKMM